MNSQPNPQVERPQVPNTDDSQHNLAKVVNEQSTSTPNREHAGATAAESKPRPSNGHDASIAPGVEKVAAEGGPPEPDWDKAEKERQEKQQDEKQGGAKADYPLQTHAGAVGYGPDIAERDKPDIQDKMKGLKETVKGKITGNRDLQDEGHKTMTGELKRKKREAQENDSPFKNAEKP